MEGCVQSPDILEREIAFAVLKRADDETERRQDQEHQGEHEERRNAQPVDGRRKRCAVPAHLVLNRVWSNAHDAA